MTSHLCSFSCFFNVQTCIDTRRKQKAWKWKTKQNKVSWGNYKFSEKAGKRSLLSFFSLRFEQQRKEKKEGEKKHKSNRWSYEISMTDDIKGKKQVLKLKSKLAKAWRNESKSRLKGWSFAEREREAKMVVGCDWRLWGLWIL